MLDDVQDNCSRPAANCQFPQWSRMDNDPSDTSRTMLTSSFTRAPTKKKTRQNKRANTSTWVKKKPLWPAGSESFVTKSSSRTDGRTNPAPCSCGPQGERKRTTNNNDNNNNNNNNNSLSVTDWLTDHHVRSYATAEGRRRRENKAIKSFASSFFLPFFLSLFVSPRSDPKDGCWKDVFQGSNFTALVRIEINSLGCQRVFFKTFSVGRLQRIHCSEFYT